MEDAELINNIPVCSLCKNSLGNIADHDIVEYKGERYFQFVRRCRFCKDKGADLLFQYCTEDLGGIRMVFPNKDIKKIKPIKTEINEKEID